MINRFLKALYCLTLSVFIAALNGQAPVITQHPTPQSVLRGGTATFTVAATGAAPLTYQWFRNGVAISGATGSSLTVNGVQVADAGYYSVTVSNAQGSAQSYLSNRTMAVVRYHSVYLKTNGEMMSMGGNRYGELGWGNTSDANFYTTTATGVTALKAGDGYTRYLKSDGTVWGTGTLVAESGAPFTIGTPKQLGQNVYALDPPTYATSAEIAAGVVRTANGDAFVAQLRTDGTLWASGYISLGRVENRYPLGTRANEVVFIASDVVDLTGNGDSISIMKRDGTISVLGTEWISSGSDSGRNFYWNPTVKGTDVALPAFLAVLRSPVFTQDLVDRSVTLGSAVALSVTVDGTGPLTYQWYKNEVAIAGAVESTFTIASMEIADAGRYYVIATNAHGSTASRTATVASSGAPSLAITTDLVDRAITLGQAATLTVVAEGVGGFMYQWFKDGELITTTTHPTFVITFEQGTKSSSLLIPAMRAADAGSYRVRVSDRWSTVNSRTAAITAVVPPLGMVNDLSDCIVVLGQAATLEIVATGTGPFTYQWFKNGAAIAGATASTYAIPTMLAGSAGDYQVRITSPFTTVTSRSARVSAALPGLLSDQIAYVGNLVVMGPDFLPAGTVRWQSSSDGGTAWSDLDDGSQYSGTRTSILELHNVSTGLSGRLYRYQYSQDGYSAASNAARLTVLAAVFTRPVGIALDSTNVLHVTDAGAQTVLRLGSDTKPAIIAGASGALGSTDGAGTAARFNAPGGVFVNPDRSLLVADTGNSMLRRISPEGVVTTLAGLAGQIGSTEGSGTAARFNAPMGVARDSAGNAYVADQMNHLVRIVSPAGATGSMAGKAGIAGSVDSLGTSALFNQPTGIVVDAAGNQYVSDQGSHVIRKVTPGGQVTTLAGAAGSSGSTDGAGATARFNRPTGLAIDRDGAIYVADTGNHAIRKIVGANVTTLAGFATLDGLKDGTGSGAWFNAPEGLAIDSANHLWVADTGNRTIRKVTPSGAVSTPAYGGNAPTITTQPAAQTVAAGSSANFTVRAAGDALLSYQWLRDGSALAGATGESFTITAVSASHVGTYTVAVTSAFGTTVSSGAALTLQSTPPVTPPSGGGGGGGGGGSFSGRFLALLLGLSVLRLLVLKRSRERTETMV